MLGIRLDGKSLMQRNMEFLKLVDDYLSSLHGIFLNNVFIRG